MTSWIVSQTSELIGPDSDGSRKRAREDESGDSELVQAVEKFTRDDLETEYKYELVVLHDFGPEPVGNQEAPWSADEVFRAKVEFEREQTDAQPDGRAPIDYTIPQTLAPVSRVRIAEITQAPDSGALFESLCGTTVRCLAVDDYVAVEARMSDVLGLLRGPEPSQLPEQEFMWMASKEDQPIVVYIDRSVVYDSDTEET